MTDLIRVEYEYFDEVQMWPRNPKDHDIHEIRKSFVRFGFTSPILLDEGTGQLVAGHGRLETLQLMLDSGQDPPNRVEIAEDGRWKVPVLRGVRFDNFAEAEAYLLADNRLTEIGGWDLDVLSTILSEIVDVDGALEGVGYDIAEVMDIIEPKTSDRGNTEERIKNRNYFILIPCNDENHQSDLLETLLGQGIDCRGVVE